MINQLVEKIKKTNAPVVVGLDPMLSYIPEHILKSLMTNTARHLKVLPKRYLSIIKEL